MSKPHKQSSLPDRISEDVLAEHWFSFVHEVFAELKAAIAKRGVTQEEIAGRLGRDPATISRCLSGRQNVTLRTMCDIARAIGYRPDIRFEDLTAMAKTGRRPAARQAKAHDRVPLAIETSRAPATRAALAPTQQHNRQRRKLTAG